MANPLIDFIDITDRYGTRLVDLTTDITTSAFSPQSVPFAAVTSLIVVAFMVVISYGLLLLDMVIRQTLFMGIVGDVYNAALQWIYQYVTPWQIASIAVLVLIGRIWLVQKLKTQVGPDKSRRIVGLQFETRTLFSDSNAKESFAKQVFNQLGNTTLLLGVIALLMANPFAIIGWLMNFASTLAGQLSSSGGGGDSARSVAVDGVVSPVLQMVNYGSSLGQSCSEQWSRTLAIGGDVSELGCLTTDQSAFTEGSAVMLATAGVGFLMIGALSYFAWQVFKPATLYLVLTAWHVAKVPWQAAWMIARPGEERRKLDDIRGAFTQAVKSLLWLMGALAIAAGGPSLIMVVARAITEQGFPAFLALVGVTAAYGFAGWAMKNKYGQPLRFTKDNFPRFVDGGTRTWGELWSNSSWVQNVREANRESGPWRTGPTDDANAANPPAAQQESDREKVSVNPEDEAVIDQATETMATSVPTQLVKVTVNPAAVVFGMAATSIDGARDTARTESDREQSAAAGSGLGAGAIDVVNGGGKDLNGDSLRASHGAAAQTYVRDPGFTFTNAMRGVGEGGRHAAPEATSPSEFPRSAATASVQRGSASADAETKQLADGSWTGQVVVPTVGVGPAPGLVERGEKLAASYRDAVRRINQDEIDGDEIDDGIFAQTASSLSAMDDIVSGALRRHQADLDEGSAILASRASETGLGGERVESTPAGVYLAEIRQLVELQNTALLARILGVRADITAPEAGVDITVDEVDDDGTVRLRFGTQRGFGDDI
ncbi:hypothetical protein [Rhodococcus sp. BS-15]|uniref:hypothetical protein n=1 Tax=Rhodococcus sp. BS-15 TaxID=1304954 RepID=UPI000B319E5D|nr:hypothetical protein [Rhodococcus sp. BS-15]